MKIFSSFDTSLKNEKKKYYTNEYGEEYVVVLSKSKLFLIIYIILPLVSVGLLLGGLLYLIYFFTEQNTETTLYLGLPVVLIAFGTIISRSVFKNYIDYNMDFCVVTPNEVEKYNQTGIVQRDVNALASEKIKSVKTNKKGIIYSVFNNGDIIFMSEGDTAEGEIFMDYIHSPEIVKKKIMKIINHNLHSHDGHG